MNDKRAVIHIGTPKTGSTTIQNLLFANRDILQERGVLFPGCIGQKNHKNLCVACAPNSMTVAGMRGELGLQSEQDCTAFIQNLLSDFKQEVSETKHDVLVLSSEHFSSRLSTVEHISRLKYIMVGLGYAPEIIVYFRRQDKLISSLTGTSLQAGNPLDFPFIENAEWYNYFTLASKWASVFGKDNLVCRPFQRGSFPNNSLSEDFLVAAKIELSGLEMDGVELNKSLNAKVLDFFVSFNQHVQAKDQHGARNPNRQNIVQLLRSYQNSFDEQKSFSFALDKRKEIIAQYREENGYLKANFDVDLDLSLEGEGEGHNAELTLDELHALVGFLWNEKANEVRSLRRTIERLRERLDRAD